jgi:hypothetical protein
MAAPDKIRGFYPTARASPEAPEGAHEAVE